MEKVEIPTKKEAQKEAQILSMKLMLSPETFTLIDLSRLQEILVNEGYMD